MEITVKLVGLFQTDRFKQRVCTYPPGTRVDDVVADLGLPRLHLGIVLINGVHAATDTRLTEGDQLMLLPLLGGG
jgi:sulfur carrier protein ThiS